MASGTVKTCQIILPQKFLGSFSKNYADDLFFFGLHLDICGCDGFFFFGIHLNLGEKLESADVITLKEPVLLLRSKNMATLF